MLQLRQEQQTPANGAAGRQISDTFYDSHGWTVKSSSAYYGGTPAGQTLFSPTTHGARPRPSRSYDGQGRAVASQFWSLGQHQWQTTTAYPGTDETDVTPPSGGTATSTITNALGETTATWAYTTPPPRRQGADADITSYTYTPGGQVATITDNPETTGPTATTCSARRSSADRPGRRHHRLRLRRGREPDLHHRRPRQDARLRLRRAGPQDRRVRRQRATANELASWTYDRLAKG